MNRFAMGVLGSVGILLLNGQIKAQELEGMTASRRSRDDLASAQHVAVELRFGRYLPDADQGLASTPYSDIFGSGNRYYGGLEVDWQLLRIPHLGTLSPGLGIGYTKSTAKAPYEAEGGRSGQNTSLEILPLYIVAVLRADVLARETLVPLVPYAKAGLGAAFWKATEADQTARADGVVGRGFSFGPQFAAGMMFLLDVLDREDALTADAELGLNHSYLFAEWFLSDLDGFGSRNRLQVGTNTWMAGIALEF